MKLHAGVWITGALCVAFSEMLLAAPAVSAQSDMGTYGPNSVQQFYDKIAGDIVLLELDASKGPNPDSVKEASGGQDDLKEFVKPALAAAQGNSDLIAAIKAYYIAANAYFQSYLDLTGLPDFDPYTNTLVLNPQQIQQKHAQVSLKADVESKEAALKLEMQLAGLN